MKITRVSTTTIRESCEAGLLEELEFGLLKKLTKEMRWTTEEKAKLLDMRIDNLYIQIGPKKIECQVRSFCHSWAVTVDFLSFEERFEGKPCILALGDVGSSEQPWAQLIQPCTYLHIKGMNVIWIDIPAWCSDGVSWIMQGSAIIAQVIRYFSIKKVTGIGCGNGASVLLQTLGQYPDIFTRTHFLLNMDLPKMKTLPFDQTMIEDNLRNRGTQLWFGYYDEEGVYDRYQGMAARLSEMVNKMSARLLGERKRNRGKARDYDEVLVTDQLNNGRETRFERLRLGLHQLMVFSDPLLASIYGFLVKSPRCTQEELGTGLVGDKIRGAIGEEEAKAQASKVLEAMSNGMRGHTDKVRKLRALQNRRQLFTVEEYMDSLMLPPIGQHQYELEYSDSRRGSYIGSQRSYNGSRTGSMEGAIMRSNSHPSLQGSRNNSRQHSRTSSRRSSGEGGGGRQLMLPEADSDEEFSLVDAAALLKPNSLGAREIRRQTNMEEQEADDDEAGRFQVIPIMDEVDPFGTQAPGSPLPLEVGR
eukprot:TRINITY_DN31506_c0_g1_i1.p1 TRINITY_DN31506_c0_g1~~TRINITY_DN31506_c0_g1_i1.p1  ORF type:complete len:531 (-),score=115.31 TRINITY_DN31506_c0_g1_i1:190-1782(-)